MIKSLKMNWKMIQWEKEYRATLFDLKFWLKLEVGKLWILRVKHPGDKDWRTVNTVIRWGGCYEMMRNAKQYAWNYHKSRSNEDAQSLSS